jgi:hypothetical protein
MKARVHYYGRTDYDEWSGVEEAHIDTDGLAIIQFPRREIELSDVDSIQIDSED